MLLEDLPPLLDPGQGTRRHAGAPRSGLPCGAGPPPNPRPPLQDRTAPGTLPAHPGPSSRPAGLPLAQARPLQVEVHTGPRRRGWRGREVPGVCAPSPAGRPCSSCPQPWDCTDCARAQRRPLRIKRKPRGSKPGGQGAEARTDQPRGDVWARGQPGRTTCSVGRSMNTCRSSRPGRSRAASRMSARLVDARTMTWSVVPIPRWTDRGVGGALNRAASLGTPSKDPRLERRGTSTIILKAATWTRLEARPPKPPTSHPLAPRPEPRGRAAAQNPAPPPRQDSDLGEGRGDEGTRVATGAGALPSALAQGPAFPAQVSRVRISAAGPPLRCMKVPG